MVIAEHYLLAQKNTPTDYYISLLAVCTIDVYMAYKLTLALSGG